MLYSEKVRKQRWNCKLNTTKYLILKVTKTSNSSVIRQEGESHNWCYKKTKHANFSENRFFLPPDTQTVAKFFFSEGKFTLQLDQMKS